MLGSDGIVIRESLKQKVDQLLDKLQTADRPINGRPTMDVI